MYIGVQSPLDADECVELLTDSGQLDMKVGSSDRVETIYRHRFRRAALQRIAPHPPQSLPTPARA